MMENTAQLRKRAESGDGAALVDLIQWLVTSPEADEREEGAQLLLASCERDVPDALCLHAALSARGVGCEQNFETAFAFLKRAAALNDDRAQRQVQALGDHFDPAAWFAPMQLVQHHPAPRIFTIEGLIPRAVCEWFIEYGRRRLEPSTVRDGATGVDIVSPGRSAATAGSTALEPDLALQLTKLRIAQALDTDVVHQEPTTILRYQPGQEYLAHYDLIRPDEEAAAAEELRIVGQRVATVLVYLNDGYDGGETFFPHLDWGFKGKPGDALIFWNMSATGERERLSLHAGLPVKSGEKWLLSQWVRAKPVPLI